MSRTFKDRPYWVQEYDTRNLRVAYHHCHKRDSVCDLEEPKRWSVGACNYWLIAPVYSWQRVEHEMVRNNYYAPERSFVRDGLLSLVKEYNSNGDVDDADPWAFPHRHAPFNGSWWN